MKEKLTKLIHLFVMSVALVAVSAFAVVHAMTALDTRYGTLVMAAYVLLFIWAGCRVVVLVKEYRRIK